MSVCVFMDRRCVFLLSFKAEQVLTLNCVLYLQCSQLVTYTDSFSDAHMQFFPTATQALPWNSQKPQCWQWQIWPSFLQRKLKNLSKNSFDLMKLASTWPSKHQDKIHLICHSCRYCLTVVHKSAVGNWEVLIFTDLFFGDFHSSTHFWWHWIEVALCTLYKNMEFFFPKSIEVGC